MGTQKPLPLHALTPHVPPPSPHTLRVTQKMRLLSITHYPLLLGANRSLLHLLIALRTQHQADVHVFCPAEGPFAEALRQNGIEYTVVPCTNWAYTVRSPGLWAFLWHRRRCQRQFWPKMLEAARQWQPDVIHSNSTVVAAGWQLAEALRVPHVWHIREFGWADYQLVFPFGKNLLYEKLCAADRVVAISGAIAKAYSAAEHRVSILYNGIGTTETIRSNAEKGRIPVADDHFGFLLVGLLQPGKRQHDAIRAFASAAAAHPEARLVIVGNGQRLYTLLLRGLVRWYGLSGKVQFTGYVAQPGAHYAEADVVLICSHHEAMGRVTAEGMSYGKPVIGFRGGATPEIIRENHNGWLYDDIQSLSRCMKYALRHRQECRQLGQNAFEDASRRFSDEHYAAGFYDILSGCLKR